MKRSAVNDYYSNFSEISQERLQDLKNDIMDDIVLRTNEEKRPEGVGKAPCLTASFKKLDID